MSDASPSACVTPDPGLLRRQALLSGLGALLTSLLYFAADFPHAYKIGLAAAVAGGLYLLFFLFFEAVYSRFAARAGAFLSAAAVLLLAFVVHYSGGVASPFVFLYFCILISEAIYGLQNPVTLPLAVVTYAGVCLAGALGLLPPANQWAAAVYHSKLFTFILITVTTGFMWMTRHITGLIVANLRRSLERENREKEVLLHKFSELDCSAQIGTLAHRIAHDLRTPLSMISGYVQMEMAKTQPADTMAQLCDLNDTVNNMAEALHNITRFGKTASAPAERLRLAELMRQLLTIASFSPQAKGVKFIRDYDDNLDLWVNASRADLQQAAFNILKNALEATQDNASGREIVISISRREKEAELTISDNGPGMDPGVLKNLFRKSLTTKKDGTGVGLVITRDLLTRNDGYIEFRNRPAGGLEVLIRLPLA